MITAPLTRRRRATLLLGLTATAAALDALTFLNLGKVFASFQSGNVLFLGLGLGDGDTGLALRAAIVLVTFLIGTAVGVQILRAGVDASGNAVLALEAALFVGFAALWITTGHPLEHPVARDILLVFAGTAMGVQMAVSMRLGVSHVFTVAITATIAFAAERIGGAREADDTSGEPSNAVVWGVIAAYGIVGLIVALLPRWPVLALAPLALLGATAAADRLLAR
jgi:uncharacterized membrane protein YoaK (UPF0700 family)